MICGSSGGVLRVRPFHGKWPSGYSTAMRTSKPLYHRHRFLGTIISYAVRLYYRFRLSLRSIEELLFERGVAVTYESIRRWCAKFGPTFAQCARQARPGPGTT